MSDRILDFLFERDTMTGKRIIFPVFVWLFCAAGIAFLVYKVATYGGACG